MKVCGAVRLGLLTALLAVGPVSEQSLGSPAAMGAAPSNESTLLQQAAASDSAYTVGFITGAPHSTDFTIAQEIATVLASGQETGPRGEMALRVLPMVGSGGIRNIVDVLTM